MMTTSLMPNATKSLQEPGKEGVSHMQQQCGSWETLESAVLLAAHIAGSVTFPRGWKREESLSIKAFSVLSLASISNKCSMQVLRPKPLQSLSKQERHLAVSQTTLCEHQVSQAEPVSLSPCS